MKTVWRHDDGGLLDDHPPGHKLHPFDEKLSFETQTASSKHWDRMLPVDFARHYRRAGMSDHRRRPDRGWRACLCKLTGARHIVLDMNRQMAGILQQGMGSMRRWYVSITGRAEPRKGTTATLPIVIDATGHMVPVPMRFGYVAHDGADSSMCEITTYKEVHISTHTNFHRPPDGTCSAARHGVCRAISRGDQSMIEDGPIDTKPWGEPRTRLRFPDRGGCPEFHEAEKWCDQGGWWSEVRICPSSVGRCPL